ncbi:MAG: ABC transporter permease [Planctomycetes bacterium]|nr:ABC transporter permease [Planctomycetota bacterium]
MTGPRPILRPGGSAARAWARLSASGAALIALVLLALLVLVAALAPFLSADAPLLIDSDQGRTWPLFSAMSRADLGWLGGLLAALAGYLVRRFGGRWLVASITALLIVAGTIGLALGHQPRHETRRYRLEEHDRAIIVELDRELGDDLVRGADAEVRAGLRAGRRRLAGSLEAELDLERRLDLVDDRPPEQRAWAFRALATRNELELGRLREAVYALNRHAPDQPGVDGLRRPGQAGHVLGSDRDGRDLLARLVHGARLAMTVAVGSVAAMLLLGLAVGLIAGWFGGPLDWLLERLNQVVLCLPVLFVLVAFSGYLPLVWRQSGLTVALIIGLVAWPQMARLVRAETRRLRSAGFVRAAEALGLSRRRIFLRHLLPNLVGPLLITASGAAGQVIVLEATFSFLGLGAVGAPSWGRILADSRAAALIDSAWHLALFPGLAVTGAVLAFNVLGDRLRDALDPRS